MISTSYSSVILKPAKMNYSLNKDLTEPNFSLISHLRVDKEMEKALVIIKFYKDLNSSVLPNVQVSGSVKISLPPDGPTPSTHIPSKKFTAKCSFRAMFHTP